MVAAVTSARPTWHEYFLDIATLVATRGTCPRKQVGTLLVQDNRIIATGYNGSIPRMPHCTDGGCDMVDGHCVRTNHAELNALLQAARYGVSTVGASAYCTLEPCWPCFRALVTAGVTKIYFKELYARDPRVDAVLAVRDGLLLRHVVAADAPVS